MGSVLGGENPGISRRGGQPGGSWVKAHRAAAFIEAPVLARGEGARRQAWAGHSFPSTAQWHPRRGTPLTLSL
jgi:hypothetical protein